MSKKGKKKETKPEPKEKVSKYKISKHKNYYIKNYKKLLLIPLILFILSIVVLIGNKAMTGDFINKDVTLEGGISLTILTDKGQDPTTVEMALTKTLPESSLNIRSIKLGNNQNGMIIEASKTTENELTQALNQTFGSLDKDEYSTEVMGSSLGKSFSHEMILALFFAFISMGLVFLYYFRALIPTLAAVGSAFLDLFVTLGVIVALGVNLTSGGIAAFLMLIGYSIDTSILLSTKILKHKGDINENIFSAMKTGLTMSAAGLAAMGLSFFLSNNTVLKQIMLIIVMGLIIDIITTWVLNVGLLRLYLDKKNAKN